MDKFVNYGKNICISLHKIDFGMWFFFFVFFRQRREIISHFPVSATRRTPWVSLLAFAVYDVPWSVSVVCSAAQWLVVPPLGDTQRNIRQRDLLHNGAYHTHHKWWRLSTPKYRKVVARVASMSRKVQTRSSDYLCVAPSNIPCSCCNKHRSRLSRSRRHRRQCKWQLWHRMACNHQLKAGFWLDCLNRLNVLRQSTFFCSNVGLNENKIKLNKIFWDLLISFNFTIYNVD